MNNSQDQNNFDKKKKFYGWLLGVAIVILILAILNAIKIIPYENYADTATGIEIKYPKWWSRVEKPGGDKTPGAVVAFIAPKETPQTKFVPNVNVSYVDVKQKFTPEQFDQVTLQQLSAIFKDKIVMIESTPIMLAGKRGRKIIFEGKNLPTPPIRYLNAWVLVGNRGYVVTYAAFATDFDENIGYVNTMLKSFKVK